MQQLYTTFTFYYFINLERVFPLHQPAVLCKAMANAMTKKQKKNISSTHNDHNALYTGLINQKT